MPSETSAPLRTPYIRPALCCWRSDPPDGENSDNSRGRRLHARDIPVFEEQGISSSLLEKNSLFGRAGNLRGTA